MTFQFRNINVTSSILTSRFEVKGSVRAIFLSSADTHRLRASIACSCSKRVGQVINSGHSNGPSLSETMTPARLVRRLLPSRLLSNNNVTLPAVSSKAVVAPTTTGTCDPRACLRNCRCFAQVHDIDKLNRDVWFTSTIPRYENEKPPDERTLQLGKTVRTVHERLPTLLLSPLPSEILSPHISLHLFPSTHPHLPTVSGRIGYVAALCTAPLAWGRLPLLGNVKLEIMSERMVRNGGSTVAHANRDEKLIVKWKTCSKNGNGIYRGIGAKDPMDKLKEFLAGAGEMSYKQKSSGGSGDEQEFCGIFIFEFDENGRVLKHVIEHTEEGGRFDRMTRVVSVTDWLLGQFNGKKKEQVPELAWCEERPNGRAIQIVDRRRRMGRC